MRACNDRGLLVSHHQAFFDAPPSILFRRLRNSTIEQNADHFLTERRGLITPQTTPVVWSVVLCPHQQDHPREPALWAHQSNKFSVRGCVTYHTLGRAGGRWLPSQRPTGRFADLAGPWRPSPDWWLVWLGGRPPAARPRPQGSTACCNNSPCRLGSNNYCKFYTKLCRIQ
jgi:hypothetical protein